MKHLVKLSDMAPRQYDEVVALLRRHGVQFKEIPSGMFDTGFIMVADRDFAAAKTILRDESREFAKEAREAWERSWRNDHGGSTIRWFYHGLLKDPVGTIGKLVLLVLMVTLFVIFPVWYVVRGGI
jgi:hypothetical protein